VFNVKLGPFRGGASKGIEIALGEYHSITIPYKNSIRYTPFLKVLIITFEEVTLFNKKKGKMFGHLRKLYPWRN